jgi:uncharacterized hydrophobic protein (TIGR00271 family)
VSARSPRRITEWLPESLVQRFDLTPDQADPRDIDETIRSGVPFRGTNLWILICATFVASIGLNVNSAAVIIGAMLISPLMGPIMGIGYAAAVNDFPLVRSAAKNLAIAVAFSLLTSTMYFLLTPLSEARSEILARTSPTIWDVLIAVFGGLAGIIGTTRRQRGNVIPGVAIATALMPPLCTAGYGIATAQPWYAIGALYLFTINSVFIGTATLIGVRIMRLPDVSVVDEQSRSRTRRYMGAAVVLTGVPSIYLAYGLVQDEVFVSRAQRFVTASFASDADTFVVDRAIDASTRSIRVTVVGEPVTPEALGALQSAMPAYGLSRGHLEVAQTRREDVDVASLRAQVSSDLVRDTLVALDEKNHRISVLEAEIAAGQSAATRNREIADELRASVSGLVEVAIGSGARWEGPNGAESASLLVSLTVERPLPPEERARLEAWLPIRAHGPVTLAVTSLEPAPPRGRR